MYGNEHHRMLIHANNDVCELSWDVMSGNGRIESERRRPRAGIGQERDRSAAEEEAQVASIRRGVEVDGMRFAPRPFAPEAPWRAEGETDGGQRCRVTRGQGHP